MPGAGRPPIVGVGGGAGRNRAPRRDARGRTAMTGEAMKAIVRRYYDEVWSRGNLALVDELMTDDYTNWDPATPGETLHGREAFKGLVTMLRTGVPDMEMAIGSQYAEGDTVVSTWTATGTHAGPL